MKKQIFMIAGPNGAGKTTTAMSLIAENTLFYEFINADEIARGLAPVHPESMTLAASKLMIKRFKDLLSAKENFALETTVAGTNYVKHLTGAKAEGYRIHLMFLWLSSPELAVKRVKQRVEQGGHFIPESTVRRRYFAGLKNLIAHYLPLSDTALILDNSIAGKNQTIAEKGISGRVKIEERNIWKQIERGHQDA